MKYPEPKNVRACSQHQMQMFPPSVRSLIEDDHLCLPVLSKTSWRVSGQKGAADLLGLKRSTLESRMKKLGITRPK